MVGHSGLNNSKITLIELAHVFTLISQCLEVLALDSMLM
jgi:hypothetical protein